MIRVTQDPIDPGVCLGDFAEGRTASGAIVSFCGLVRDRTGQRPVRGLVLDAYPGFTEAVMAQIEREAQDRFAVDDLLSVHRWGPMRPGDVIVFVAAAARHRRDAFQAADFLMDQFKTRAPFWKREDGPDGPRWIEPRPEDREALQRWTREDAPS